MATENPSSNNSDVVSNDELGRRVLGNFAKLVSDMRAAPISDWLIQENIISVEEWHGIEASGIGRTRNDINRALLRHLLNLKNPRTFLVFKIALKETASPWLERLLDQPSRATVEQLKQDEALIASDKDEQNDAKERDQQLEEIRKQLEIKLKENENLKKQVAEIKERLNLEKEENKQQKKELEDMKQQLKRERKTIEDNKKAMDEMKKRLQRQQNVRGGKDTEDLKENVMDKKIKNSNSPKQFQRSKNVRPVSSPEKAMPSKKKQQQNITYYFST